ncbi:hypothetical protein BV25DRAFT_1026425 [Artomyces pyxidatus]|uniref:Uncharacterized protein n=1 Tax=Artomyces pyxidatus TaxID=48021 RepID=A0ACB8SUA8_9AGAM|nr:hypothetical protein BV25DRAFT_1026425 [Artomyces pyxidatus]
MLLLLLFACAFLSQSAYGSPVASLTALAPVNSTIPQSALTSTPVSVSNTCTDISICRTKYTIIWSSLVTILACVWTAVHRNVPAPEEVGESRTWRIVCQASVAAKIVLVAALVPEWVFAWAVRQRLNAREIGRELEAARLEAEGKWSERLKGARPAPTEGDTVGGQSATATSTETSPFLGNEARPTSTHNGLSGERSEEKQPDFDDSIVTAKEQTGRLRGKWTARHGFFVTMGGFHYYKDGEPRHPLSRHDVVQLVRRGDLVPPTDEEIRNWSQGDVLSKTIAVVQTLWFVIQAIARRIEGLPITQLEIMTLAYTTITVAMYVAWWDKPQNVGGPVRVAVKELPEPALVQPRQYWSTHIFYVIAGMQDTLVDLRHKRHVPTFYGGSTYHNTLLVGGSGHNHMISADVTALCAAIVFGAVHCVAWSYAFPTPTEHHIWRVFSLIIVTLPAAMLVPVLAMLIMLRNSVKIPDIIGIGLFPFLFTSCSLPYIAARLHLLALSFSTLRSLPPEAYHAVQWTLLIPHFT